MGRRARWFVWSSARILNREPGRETRLTRIGVWHRWPSTAPIQMAVQNRERRSALSEGTTCHDVTRFVGLDVHRSYASVAAVDANQEPRLSVRRIDYTEFDEWIRKNLRPTDAVALES